MSAWASLVCRIARCLPIWSCLLLPTLSGARVISVGPEGEVQRIDQAAELAQDGDVVEIASGVYRGDVAVWRQRRLTLRGLGPRPVLIAEGRSAEAKGIWVLKNGDFRVSNLEFRGSRVADGNGAGIRFERGRLSVHDCVFEDNQHGILTNNDAQAELSIENSRFGRAPPQSMPPPHLLYTGQIASLRIQGSRFHDGHTGHLIKSRARRSELRYNLIYDGPQGSASYELEFPNGGAVTLVGNIIGQAGASANPTIVAYGAEGQFWPQNRLDMAHNTLINNRWLPAWFVRVWRSTFPATLELKAFNNLFVGLGLSSRGIEAREQGNLHAGKRALPKAGELDFRLTADSALRTVPAAPADVLRPTAEFLAPFGISPLQAPSIWAPGAFQTALPDSH